MYGSSPQATNKAAVRAVFTFANQDSKCLLGIFFCPTGTSDPLIGSVANDRFVWTIAVGNDLKAIHVLYNNVDIFSILKRHDLDCRYSFDKT